MTIFKISQSAGNCETAKMDVCGMYRMPSLYDSSSNVVLPDCMYTMKSIYEPVKATSEGVPDGTVVDERLVELEKKQEEILHSLCKLTAKLKELKADVIYIPADVPNITSKESKADVHHVPKATPVVETKSDTSFVDVVMYASPSQPPPLSLLIIYEWLSTWFSVHATCHVHSEITDVHPHLRDFFHAGNSQGQRACHQIALTLIWKEVEDDFLMMVNPFKQRHVAGEVNVVRYLCNIMASVKFPNAAQATEIDSWLDVAHFSVVQGNNKERQAALRNLNSILGKSRYLVGDKITAADVFMWGSLTRCKLTRDAPPNVKKWIGECQKDAIFQSAVQFVQKHQM